MMLDWMRRAAKDCPPEDYENLLRTLNTGGNTMQMTEEKREYFRLKKREQDAKQRALGRKAQTFWLTAKEHELLRDALTKIRGA